MGLLFHDAMETYLKSIYTGILEVDLASGRGDVRPAVDAGVGAETIALLEQFTESFRL